MSEDPPRTDEYQGYARLYDPLLNPLLDRPRHGVAALVRHCLRPFALPGSPPTPDSRHTPAPHHPGPAPVQGAISPQELPPVLDLCCGTGRQAAFLHGLGFCVHGLDLSPAMLDVARKTTPAEIQYRLADATETGLPDAAFGCVCISLALHEKNPHTREAILAEAMRLLLPGGSLVLLDYRLPESGLGRASMRFASMIERLAGQAHYAHYRQFLAGGGIRALLGASRLPFRRMETYFHGCMGLYRVFTSGNEE